jgi:tRNA (guanosine-2'-O-)-methyltransferase
MSDRTPHVAKTATQAEMRDLIASTPTDDPSWFQYADAVIEPNRLTDLLAPHVTDARREAIESVLDQRTENLCVVLEGLVDYGNVSAVMRSAEAFGVQRVHTIDTAAKYKRSKRTTQGADKWLDRHRWDATTECLSALADDGYRVILADVAEGATPLSETDLTGRCAIVFGNELEGLTEVARSMADEVVSVPMLGFTESFNISVAASLFLYEAVDQRQRHHGANGDLPSAVRDRIRAVWYAKSVPNSRSVVEHKLLASETDA